MKKAFIISVCCTILFAISPIAYSAEGLYVTTNLGLTIPNDFDLTDSTMPAINMNVDSDLGLAFGSAVGYDFGNNTRIEGEIAYQENDLDKGSFLGADIDLVGDSSSVAFLLNGYYDFANETAFTPFVCAGIGFAVVEVDFGVPGIVTFCCDDKVFAYQLGVGVGYAINEEITFDVKYRYLLTSDPHFATTTADYSSHNFYVGIRVAF
jgi:opacity protein-like surface antigen